MPNLRIFTIYHRGEPPHHPRPPYLAIYTGLTSRYSPNIADLTSAGEMRAHYWIWKNARQMQPHLDFVGFQHYRRWMDLSEARDKIDTTNDPGEFEAFTHYHTPSEDIFDYDVIATRPWPLRTSIAEQYREAHISAHWDELLRIVPDFRALGQATEYHAFNIFLAKWDVFDRYMQFWWDLVQGLMARISIPLSHEEPYQHRALAFLSERIFSMWLTREQEQNSALRVGLCPLVMNVGEGR